MGAGHGPCAFQRSSNVASSFIRLQCPVRVLGRRSRHPLPRGVTHSRSTDAQSRSSHPACSPARMSVQMRFGARPRFHRHGSRSACDCQGRLHVKRQGMAIWPTVTLHAINSLANAASGTVVALACRLLSLTTSELALSLCGGACCLAGRSDASMRIHDGPRRSPSMVQSLQATASLSGAQHSMPTCGTVDGIARCLTHTCNAVWNSNQTRSASYYRPFA
jgi:hypothetical protein